MECSRSGKTDAQWCIKNRIRPATFYNCAFRLRKRDCDIPESNWNELEFPAQHQDVVLLDIIPKSSALVVMMAGNIAKNFLNAVVTKGITRGLRV